MKMLVIQIQRLSVLDDLMRSLFNYSLQPQAVLIYPNLPMFMYEYKHS